MPQTNPSSSENGQRPVISVAPTSHRGPLKDRYQSAGLANNPFATPPVTGPPLETFVFVGREPLRPGPEAQFLQLIGDRGTGKSTHLQYWRSSFDGPYHHVPRTPYRQRYARPPIGPIVYGDEIDRMPVVVRWKWFRQLARDRSTLVIGTHKDLASLAQRAGFQIVHTHHLQAMNRKTLGLLVERRLAHAAQGQKEPRFTFSVQELDQIHHKSGGNPRKAQSLCHQLLAERLQ